MKNRLMTMCWVLCAALVVCASALAVTEENSRAIQSLDAMSKRASEVGVVAIAQDARENHWIAPKMFSLSFIQRLPEDEDGHKQVEIAKNRFGLELAKMLTKEAVSIRNEKSASKLEAQLDSLFYLRAWLGNEVGYENMFIQKRAYDLATVIVIKMIADLDYPIEKAEAQLARFNWKWADAENRRVVLNEESGGNYFSKGIISSAQSVIEHDWKSNFRDGQIPSEINQQPGLWILTLPKNMSLTNSSLPEEVWGDNRYLEFTFSEWGLVSLRSAPALLEFRKRYGKFPLKAVSYQKRDSETEIEAAFWELSWKKPYGVQDAWHLFSEVHNGTLCDEGEYRRRNLK